MSTTSPAQIDIQVKTEYLPSYSRPESNVYRFAYYITISNQSAAAVTLLSRHWFITDGNDRQEEVRGEGVVGKQPRIPAGTSYSYSSGCVLVTPVGCMHGSYQMQTDNSELIEVPIPLFSLSVPGAVN